MAVYELPAEERWPAGLARVIEAYMQGKDIKRQRALEEQQTAAAQKEALLKQQKTESDIAMKKAYMNLLKGLGGGGRPEGPSQGGYDAMPGLEGGGARVSGWGPSGPRVEFQKPRTAEELIDALVKLKKSVGEISKDDPKYQLARKIMLNLESQLAKLQGMEVKRTPGEKKSLFGIDSLWPDVPEKSELVPIGPQPRKRVESREIGPQLPRRTPSNLSVGEEVDDLIRTGKAGVMGRMDARARRPQAKTRKGPMVGKRLETTKYAAGQKPSPNTPLERPPAPKDASEAKDYAKVMNVWFYMATNVQYSVYEALEAGLTWKEIATADDIKNYLKY